MRPPYVRPDGSIVGFTTSCEFRYQRSVARVVRHGDDVYIETEGNHDGQVVYTYVRVPRAEFVERLKLAGGIIS